MRSEDGISDQSEATYRQDGDQNAGAAEHTVANGVSVFGRVSDGFITAVKPSTVRFNSAGLNDQEREAGQCEEAASGTQTKKGVVGVGVGEGERDGSARLMSCK